MDTEKMIDEIIKTFDSVDIEKLTKTLNLSIKGENLILLALNEFGGTSTPGKLIENLEFTAARLSAITKSLEHKGYVKRMKNKGDRRSRVISLTSEGKEHLEFLKQQILRNAMTIIERLGQDDVQEFLRIIKKLSVIADAMKDDEQ